jgi:hypothetical protein
LVEIIYRKGHLTPLPTQNGQSRVGGGSVFLLVLTLVSHAVAQTCLQPPAGLVGWWPGDGDARDIAAGNDGTLQGGTGFATGIVAQAFSFDGVDDFVSVPHEPSQNIREALTIDAWVMKKGLCQRLNCIVLMKEDVPASLDEDLRYGLLIFDEGGVAPGRVSLSLNTGIWEDVVISNTVLQENIWYHVAGTYDGSTAKIYVNGILENSAQKSGLILPSTGGAIKIGQESAVEDPGPPEFFNGLIDEVELYNRALSAEEIAALFNAGSAGKCKAITVKIDIKPGSFPNSINPRSKGKIPVAILTTDTINNTVTFDATTVDPFSVRFGPKGAKEAHHQGHVEDVNHDGEPDLLLHFKTQATGIQCGDTSATLTGETFGGQAIQGTDSIKTVGCK